MDGLTLGLTLGLGLPVLALHLVSVTLARALRTYSRSRLEEVCAARGHPGRAEAIAQRDERTERSAEAMAVLTGLALAALLGSIANQIAPHLAIKARDSRSALSIGQAPIRLLVGIMMKRV